jgi:hypothetical protein
VRTRRAPKGFDIDKIKALMKKDLKKLEQDARETAQLRKEQKGADETFDRASMVSEGLQSLYDIGRQWMTKRRKARRT